MNELSQYNTKSNYNYSYGLKYTKNKKQQGDASGLPCNSANTLMLNTHNFMPIIAIITVQYFTVLKINLTLAVCYAYRGDNHDACQSQ